jgi:Putative binding domain, N-terminal/Domain of unknown function (DUF5666)/Viral BACON domain
MGTRIPLEPTSSPPFGPSWSSTTDRNTRHAARFSSSTWFDHCIPSSCDGWLKLVSDSPGPRVAALTVVLLIVAGCSSSSTEITAPTTVRGGVELVPSRSTVEAAGGNGEIHLATNRDCPWEARSTADWLTLTAPASGQGDRELRFTASDGVTDPALSRWASRRMPGLLGTRRFSSPDTATRSLRRGEPHYRPRHRHNLVASSRSRRRRNRFHRQGEAARLRFRASDSSCVWTAVSSASWISVATGSGSGSSDVRFVVAANTGAARTGTLTVAGRAVTVNQAAAPETGTIDLQGEVSGVTGQCPTLTFSLEGRLVRTNAATDFRERCDRIETGRRLRITGVVQGDGLVLAVRVREGD